MAADSSSETRQGTGPHTDKGIPIIIALMVALMLLMAAVNQGHNSVNEGSEPVTVSGASAPGTSGAGG